MDSYQAFAEFFQENGIKLCAADVGKTPGWLYRWSTKKDGETNPLDHIQRLTVARNDTRLVKWLCHNTGGVFMPVDTAEPDLPVQDQSPSNREQVANQVVLLMTELMGMVLAPEQKTKEFAKVKTKGKSKITLSPEEAAATIREHGDLLQQALKLFVIYLEKDRFNQ